MQPITSLSLSSDVRDTLVAAVAATLVPFGSLPFADSEESLRLAAALVDGNTGEVDRILAATDADQWSRRVESTHGAITIRTPTSGTLITVSLAGVHVSFGERGSTARATTILAAAVPAGVRFVARTVDGTVPQPEIVASLLDDARLYVAALERNAGHYTEAARQGMLAKARLGVARLESAA